MSIRHAAMASLLVVGAAQAQQEGWSYSPLHGEGDRATLGCALRSTPELFACLAVRCEDDFSVGIYVHTSAPQSDEGEWLVTVDRVNRLMANESNQGPYGVKLADPDGWLLNNLKNGAVAYLQPMQGSLTPLNFIPLAGSLYEINRALAYCAPKLRAEPNGLPGVTPPNP